MRRFALPVGASAALVSGSTVHWPIARGHSVGLSGRIHTNCRGCCFRRAERRVGRRTGSHQGRASAAIRLYGRSPRARHWIRAVLAHRRPCGRRRRAISLRRVRPDDAAVLPRVAGRREYRCVAADLAGARRHSRRDLRRMAAVVHPSARRRSARCVPQRRCDRVRPACSALRSIRRRRAFDSCQSRRAGR